MRCRATSRTPPGSCGSVTIATSSAAKHRFDLCDPTNGFHRSADRAGGYARRLRQRRWRCVTGAADRRRRDRRLCPCQRRAGELCAVHGKAPLLICSGAASRRALPYGGSTRFYGGSTRWQGHRGGSCRSSGRLSPRCPRGGRLAMRLPQSGPGTGRRPGRSLRRFRRSHAPAAQPGGIAASPGRRDADSGMCHHERGPSPSDTLKTP
jgi:hypothetical protein